MSFDVPMPPGNSPFPTPPEFDFLEFDEPPIESTIVLEMPLPQSWQRLATRDLSLILVALTEGGISSANEFRYRLLDLACQVPSNSSWQQSALRELGIILSGVNGGGIPSAADLRFRLLEFCEVLRMEDGPPDRQAGSDSLWNLAVGGVVNGNG